jgi:hypothetical protein
VGANFGVERGQIGQRWKLGERRAHRRLILLGDDRAGD